MHFSKIVFRLRYLYLIAISANMFIPSSTRAQVNFSDQVKEIGRPIYGDTGGDLKLVIANIVRVILGFVGIVFLILIIWGGMQWMLSGGNEQKIEDAKKRIVNATIGLALIVCAYAIASFVVNALGRAVGNDGGGGSNDVEVIP